MKDPDSTQFRGDYLEGDGWLCGELNSKNEYGAYAGFKRFLSNAKSGKIFIEGMQNVNEGNLEESTSEVIARLSKETEILARENASRENGGPIISFSQQERNRMVEQGIFEDRWAENCPSSAIIRK